MTSPGRHPQPTIEPTSPSWVVVSALLGAGSAWLLLSTLQRLGESLPRIEPVAWVSVGVVAAGIAFLAVSTSRIVRERRADLDARSAVTRLLLGKTSILGGSGLGAAYLFGVIMAAPAWPAPLAQGRVINGSIAAVLCVAWAVAGWFLERACRVPRDPDDDTPGFPPDADDTPPPRHGDGAPPIR